VGDKVREEVGSAIIKTKVREFQTLGVVLGYRYVGSPIVVSDGSTPPPEHVSDYRPSACPGCLAPHAWLADGSSLYDHFGSGFTLLVVEDGAASSTAVDRMVHTSRLGSTTEGPHVRRSRVAPLYAENSL
jgi:hypothetical protein